NYGKCLYDVFLAVAQASCLCVFGRLAHLNLLIPRTRNKLRYYQRGGRAHFFSFFGFRVWVAGKARLLEDLK
ncbi:MAG: hypothetical protein NT118_15360, partial [Lentisphaerae bacterium]|nr:hypothetical protein [Lentisphaerota bacterium]